MFSFNFELGFPSVLCFPLLEFMVKILNIRFKYFEDIFVAEVLLSYPMPRITVVSFTRRNLSSVELYFL